MTSLTGLYYDGVSSLSRPVTIVIAADRIRVAGDDIERDEPIDAVTFSDPIGRTPRFIRFHDKAFCEVPDGAALDRALAVAIHGTSHLHQWEGSWRWVAVGGLVIILAAILAYRVGLPFAAGVVASRLPVNALEMVSDQTLQVLDGQLLTPTMLSNERRDAIRAAFSRLRVPDEARNVVRLEFRNAEALGANALALPSGVIVVTDQLVALAKSDDEIVGVLAHEVGHVEQRHSLRNLIQSSIVAAVITAYVGDVSALAAAAPTALLNARYSREFEREADAYAVRTLRANRIDPVRLADILERMEKERPAGQGALGALTYLSSHPTTDERLRILRGR